MILLIPLSLLNKNNIQIFGVSSKSCESQTSSTLLQISKHSKLDLFPNSEEIPCGGISDPQCSSWDWMTECSVGILRLELRAVY